MSWLSTDEGEDKVMKTGSTSIKFAVLAAGEGSRLAEEGIMVPKPFVTIAGKPMIVRLLDIFKAISSTQILMITNDAVYHYMTENGDLNEVQLIVKTTPSSMHSLYELMPSLGNGPFILTTVDTIFREEEFKRYVNTFVQAIERGEKIDGMMAVTDFVDDEKPLWVSTDQDFQITGFHDSQELFRQSGVQGECRFVSGGIYGLTSSCFPTLIRCIESGQSRMRNFQRALVSDGLRLVAYPFSKILDVDHAEDIQKAEAFLQQEPLNNK